MKNNKTFLLLITPSGLSSVIGAALAILGTAAVIVLSRFQTSQLRQEIFEARGSGAAGSSYRTITTNIANNHILGVAPLFIVWACVGLVVYYFTIALVHAFGQAVTLHEQLEYINSPRQALLKQAAGQLSIRLLATVGWFLFIKLTLSVFIPYALASANIAAHSLSISNALYALLAVVIIFIDVYVHTVFLRLITLKPRLFGS